MGWEKRGRGNYFYRKVWQNGTCRSEYIGAGLVGRVAADRDRRPRHARQGARKTAEVETRQIDELSRLVNTLLGSHLLLAGYHQHKRQWRKQRDQTTAE